MGGDLFRKYVSSSVLMCCRLVAKHPFVVGLFIVLFCLYRLFPMLFSVLVSVSPVVVSTFVLLGTLLSFGQPNVPEIEKEHRNDRYESRVSESKVLSDSEIVGRDASFGYEEESNVSRNEVVVEEKSFEVKTSVIDDEIDNSCVVGDRNVSLVDNVLLQKQRELDEEKKVVLGSRYSPLKQSEDEHEHENEHEHIVLESDDKLWEGSPDPLNTNAGLLWKRVEGGDDDDEDDDDDDDDDDEGSDSGSDLAESSSPDASMADIIPMLDELHPLLSEEHEAREVPHMSRDGIDAVSDHSLESSDTCTESNDDDDGGGIENVEGGDVRNDEEDKDKELKHIDKEDETRSAILWTEYDQKNLMNLGTSEMERNRRLENLIARRRARKTMRMQAEKNLIDFESTDLPWDIPPISTARINPFDYDSNDNIPGSAPSVLLKRRNPFDLPYDSSEEKPDLVGDTFQQEFAVVQPNEPFFRRHESFNVGPSVFGASRNERQEPKLRPYFVPERSFADFQRQFSGLSDSKVSSVPDTESVSSVGDIENRDNIEDDFALEAEQVSEKDHECVSDDVSHIRPYFVPEHVASDQTSFSSFQRQISEVSDSKGSSVPDTDSVSSASDPENKDLNEDDHSLEAELVSVVDREHATEIREHVSEHGNQESGSDEDDVESVQVLKADEGLNESEIIVRGVTNEQERASGFLGTENAAGIQLNMGDEGSHSSETSLSSSDEPSEQVYNEKEDDMAESVPKTTYFVDRVNSMERSDIDITSSSLEEGHPNEPIYDLSPRSVTRNLSSSSILNDLHKDESFQYTEDQQQASSPVADVKLNSKDSSPETSNAQNQLLTVDNEDSMLADDNVSTSLPSKAPLETENVSDIDASQHLDQVQVLSSISHARSHEEVISQVNEESLLGGSITEDPEALQGCELEQGQVASSNSESVHGEASEIPHQYVSGKEALSQQQKEFLLDTSVDKPLEETPQILQVQITNSSSGNLEVQELENSVSSNVSFVPSAEPDVVEVADIETTAPGSPVYASDTLSIENNVPDDFADVDEVKEIDEDLLVELDTVGDFSVMDLGTTSNEMKEDPHVLEHDLETMPVADEESNSEDMEAILDEMKQDPHASEHDIETHNFVDEDSSSEDLRSTLYGMKQDPQASGNDLETKNSEGEDSYSNDLGFTFNEKKQEPHASDLDLETKNSDSKDFELPLDETNQDLHASEHSENGDSAYKDLESTLDEMQQEPQAADHDLETEPTRDEGTDFKNLASTLDEMQQRPRTADHDLETEPSRDEVSDSKDIGSTSDEMQQESLVADHDLETEPSRDEGTQSMNLESPLDETEPDPYASKHDLETNCSVDEDSYSKDLESTFNEIRRVSQASEHRLDTFYSVDENFYSKRVESSLNEMKGPQSLGHDIETKHSDGETDTDVMKSQNEKLASNMEGAGASEAEVSKLINSANGVALLQEADSSASLANPTSARVVNHETENASNTSNTDKE
uniref:dentin sialophosphoprotein isoform X2 n=1 Tax=Erigeron canadensis TaxID=72917 RepID=UPI001CB98528|nr:dentin sialophosphoprotein isoform X2 [Erigeron canadensis]